MQAPALQRCPELWAENEAPFTAFCRLSKSRQPGLAPGPIPVSEVLAYCQLIGLDDAEEALRLLDLVQACDSVFLAHVRKQDPATKKPAP